MPTPKKPKEIINSKKEQWMYRLQRLPIVKQYKVSAVIAYIGLQMCNKGKIVEFNKAMKIVMKSKLNLKIESNSAIPCNNILKAMINLAIYKRELLTKFYNNEELEIWQDETAAPLFDILKEINEVYKI